MEFRRTFEGTSRPTHKKAKTAIHKIIEEKNYDRISKKLLANVERSESEKMKKTILNKKKPLKEMRPLAVSKKEERKKEKER